MFRDEGTQNIQMILDFRREFHVWYGWTGFLLIRFLRGHRGTRHRCLHLVQHGRHQTLGVHRHLIIHVDGDRSIPVTHGHPVAPMHHVSAR